MLKVVVILWVVHADRKQAGLRSVLVAHHQGVLARVGSADGSDGDAGVLAVLELEHVALVAHQLSIVLGPAHLGRGVAPHVAGQVKRLGEGKKNVK